MRRALIVALMLAVASGSFLGGRWLTQAQQGPPEDTASRLEREELAQTLKALSERVAALEAQLAELQPQVARAQRAPAGLRVGWVDVARVLAAAPHVAPEALAEVFKRIGAAGQFDLILRGEGLSLEERVLYAGRSTLVDLTEQVIAYLGSE